MKSLVEYINEQQEQEINEGLFDFLSTIVTSAYDFAKNAVNAVITGEKNILDFASNIFSKATDTFKDVAKTGADLWNGMYKTHEEEVVAKHKDNSEEHIANNNNKSNEKIHQAELDASKAASLIMAQETASLDKYKNLEEKVKYLESKSVSNMTKSAKKMNKHKKIQDLSKEDIENIHLYLSYMLTKQAEKSNEDGKEKALELTKSLNEKYPESAKKMKIAINNLSNAA